MTSASDHEHQWAIHIDMVRTVVDEHGPCLQNFQQLHLATPAGCLEESPELLVERLIGCALHIAAEAAAQCTTNVDGLALLPNCRPSVRVSPP